MNSVSLIVVDQTSSGCNHIKIIIDEKDSGILYLTSDQFDFISKSLWRACTNEGIPFDIKNPFDENNFDDDEEE
jgi:hypothetical protein